jgi:hypothetical protein
MLELKDLNITDETLKKMEVNLMLNKFMIQSLYEAGVLNEK